MILSSRICPACGTTNPQQAAFCFGCGKPLPTSLSASSPMQPAPQSMIKARYRIVSQLGKGGFGAVYKAEDSQLGNRLVAIKEMSQQSGLSLQESQEAIEAFKGEALMLADLMHPNLPRIYDHFMDAGHWYLVMDFIEGETLEEHLNKAPGGYLPLKEALDIGIQLCSVLSYLHTRHPPIIFRDLKPANVMLSADEHVYLIDFGIARHFKPGQARDTIAFGSPGYAAPEQYGKMQTTPQSDVYSLGATLHQMLTGDDPSVTPFRFASLHLHGQPAPAAFATLVERLIEMDENRRPTSMAVVKEDLQHIATALENGTLSLLPASPPLAPGPPLGTVFCTYHGTYENIRSVTWSPDDLYIVSAGNGSAVDIWHADSGEGLLTYRGHSQHVRSVAWSPDGTRIASASEDRTVQVWEMRTGKLLLTYHHEHYVDGVAWSPDSQRIVSASIDKTARVWDATTGNTFVVYRGHSDVIYSVAWSSDGMRIATGGYDTTVQVWNAISGRRDMIYRGHNTPVQTISWSPDSAWLASASTETSVQVWNVRTGEQLLTYYGHQGEVKATAWSPVDLLTLSLKENYRIASCSADKTVHIWHALTGDTIFTFHGHNSSVTTAAWSHDASHLASGANNTVLVWQAK
jgi:eukaryotic-like serine/threonine-protein kinase